MYVCVSTHTDTEREYGSMLRIGKSRFKFVILDFQRFCKIENFQNKKWWEGGNEAAMENFLVFKEVIIRAQMLNLMRSLYFFYINFIYGCGGSSFLCEGFL